MPRAAKESEDEGEIKIGRRTRATAGASIVDSPLRRSTRHKQPVNQDDGSSPESIASDAAGPPARSTRSKITTMEYSTSDNIRSLRPRKNSTASDTTDFADGEAPGDIKKRITRRSVTVPSVETPTKVRLRRTSRAGSESKTMSPAVRTTRRTRASSVDLEDTNETPRDKSLMIHLDTPLKMRNRASALPSEPSVVEEPDSLQKEVLDSDGHNLENTDISNNSSIDRMKSPVSWVKSGENEGTAQKDIENTSARVSISDSMQSCDDVFENPSNNSSTSPFKTKTDFELREKLMSEMDLPKIVLYKTDVPTQKSPGNKENEKSNIIKPDKKFKTSNSNMLSQRKSENFTAMKKIQMEERLNRSVDDRSLINIHNQSVSMLSSPSNPSRCDPLETSIKNRSLSNTNIASVTIGSKDESVVFLEERIDVNDHKESVDDHSNEETIHIEPQLRRKSLQNVSEQSLENSVTEIDTTVDNVACDDTENNSGNVSIDVRSEVVETSEVTKDDAAAFHSTVANVSQHTVEDNDEDSSSLSVQKSIGSNTQTTGSLIESLNAPDSEVYNMSENSINIESEETMKHNERRSSLNKQKSTRRSETRKSSSTIENSEKNNVSSNEDMETDVENLFQDISAEEWKAAHSITDECSNVDDVEHRETNYESVFGGNESWKITRKDRASKLRDTSDYDSDDTVIMQTTNTLSKCSETPHFAIIEESTNVAGDDDDTEIDQGNKSIVAKSRKKSLSKSRRSSTNLSSENNENNEQANEDEQINKDLSVPSNRKSFEKETRKIQVTEASDSGKNLTDIKIDKRASRKSLDIKSVSSKNDNKLKRRTIEKMDLTECHKSRRQSILTKENEMDIDENISDGQKEMECSLKSSEKRKRRSLKVSNQTPEKQPIQDSIDEEMNTNDDVRPLSNQSNQRRSSGGKSNSKKNSSATIEVNSDADSERLGSDGDDENDHAAIMPEFLFNVSTSGDSSDNDESASINSDVAREFNLNGDTSLKYSDDDVAGDECRASETETSDDDDDDDDMADFVVDDDEDIEEEQSAEENESENEESEMELSVEKNEIENNETNESADSSNIRLKMKPKRLDSSSSDYEDREVINGRLSQKKVTNVSRPSSSKKLVNDDNTSMNSSTPKIRRKSSEFSLGTTAKTPSLPTTPDTLIMNKSQSNTSMHESTEIVRTPTRAVESSKIQNTSAKVCSPQIIMSSNDAKLPRSKSLNHNPPANQSMQIAPTESPEMKLLMKEKLNESLPALKLKRRSLKASRRSSLMNVKESVDEHSEKLIEESTIEHVESSNEAKEKETMHVDHIESDKSNAGFVVEDESVGKKKKKKNRKNTKTDTLISEQNEQPKNKTNKKQKVEVVDKIPVDAKKSSKKVSKVSSTSDVDLSLNTSVEMTQVHSSTVENNKSNKATESINKTKKKMAKDSTVKSEEKKKLKSAENSGNVIPSKKLNIKRLSEDVLENLTDVPTRPKKRRKVDQQILPSKSMFDVKDSPPQHLSIDNVDYISVSGSGGTSQFSVVNLKKSTTKRSKKLTAAMIFRERILARNKRQPVSAYLMYQEKLKASGRDKN